MCVEHPLSKFGGMLVQLAEKMKQVSGGLAAAQVSVVFHSLPLGVGCAGPGSARPDPNRS